MLSILCIWFDNPNSFHHLFLFLVIHHSVDHHTCSVFDIDCHEGVLPLSEIGWEGSIG
jgi:hypothetical protein